MFNKEKCISAILKLLPYIVISTVTTLIWFRFLIFDDGFISFGNSVYPIDSVQIFGLIKESIIFGYNPFAYGGSILPGTNNLPEFITSLVNSAFLVFLRSFLSTEWSIKVYIISLNLFMSFTSILLLNSITKNKLVLVFTSLFIVLNPFQLQILAYGDTGQMEQIGFLFLSLYFAISFARSYEARYLDISFATIFLILVYPFFQAFILGGILIVAIIILKLGFIFKRHHFKERLRSLFMIIIVLPSALYVFWPYLFGGNNLLPNSTLAQSFSNFTYYSEPFWKVLFLQGYSPFVSSIFMEQFVGTLLARIWLLMFDVFLIFLLLFVPMLSRKWASMLISIGIIVSSLFGSGANSPIAVINDFLYLHIPGYQTLNTSYYWDWILISTLYFIQLAIGLDWLLSFNKTSHRVHYFNWVSHINKVNKKVAITIIVFLLVSSFVPFITQGYYQDGYIKTVNLPKDYYEIPTLIKDMAGNSYTGVAFFNPDNLLYLNNNTSNGFNSPFFNMIPFKTYGLPNYAAPPFNSSYYLYWVYSLFYKNETTELGNLLAVLGVQYFVVLYNSNSLSGYGQFMPWSKNVNASALMKYQKGIRNIYNSKNFSIYDNLFYGGESSAASKLSIVMGNYSSMSELANYGVNLSVLAPIYYPTLKNINLNKIMPYIGNVFYQKGQIYDLIYADQNETEINLLNSISNSNTDIYTQWINSQRLIGGGYTSPSILPAIVTDGRNSISYYLNVSVSGHYSIWIKALNTPGNGYINVSVNKVSFDLATGVNTSKQNSTSLYKSKWYKIETNLTIGSNLIDIASSNNYNGISAIFYGQSGEFSSFLKNILEKFQSLGINFYSLQNVTSLNVLRTAPSSKLSLTSGGFNIYPVNNITIIRNSYYGTFTPIGSNTIVIPSFNGLNFIVISNKVSRIMFYPIDFYVISVAVPSLFIILSIIIPLIWRWELFQNKTRKLKK